MMSKESTKQKTIKRINNKNLITGAEIIDLNIDTHKVLKEFIREDELKKSYMIKEIKITLTNNLVNIANTLN